MKSGIFWIIYQYLKITMVYVSRYSFFRMKNYIEYMDEIIFKIKKNIVVKQYKHRILKILCLFSYFSEGKHN